MSAILEIFGRMLKVVSLDSGSWGYAVIIMAVIAKVATFFVSQHEIRTLQMTEILQPEFDAISKKHAKNKDEKMKQIILLGKRTGYKMFAGISNVITQTIIVAVLAAAFFFPSSFLNGAGSDMTFQFFWIKDISIAPFQVFVQGGESVLLTFLYSMILPVLVLLMYNSLAKYIAAHSLIDKTAQQRGLQIGLLVIMFMTPQAVGIYLAALVLTTILQYAITLKFFHLPPNFVEDIKK